MIVNHVGEFSVPPVCSPPKGVRKCAVLVFVHLHWPAQAPLTTYTYFFLFSYVGGHLRMLIRFRGELKSSTCTPKLREMNETNSAV